MGDIVHKFHMKLHTQMGMQLANANGPEVIVKGILLISYAGGGWWQP